MLIGVLFQAYIHSPFHSSSLTVTRSSGHENEAVISIASLLRPALRQIDAKQAEISLRWNISSYPLFLSLMDIPLRSWNIQKHKFMLKLLSPASSFIVGFSGSSITAGHDSFFNESFPIVFFHDLNSIFKTLNVTFTVRNHALGNNPCYPYDACIATHVGLDVDMITWEQSLNCGHDPKPVESFTRSAVRAEKKVLYILSSFY